MRIKGEIKWKKIQAGEYESEDGMFYILKKHNRLIGNYWELRDRTDLSYFQGFYYENTFRDCKSKAEALHNETTA